MVHNNTIIISFTGGFYCIVCSNKENEPFFFSLVKAIFNNLLFLRTPSPIRHQNPCGFLLFSQYNLKYIFPLTRFAIHIIFLSKIHIPLKSCDYRTNHTNILISTRNMLCWHISPENLRKYYIQFKYLLIECNNPTQEL